MIVEIQFHDSNGSVCPYCGQPLQVAVSRGDAETVKRKDYETKIYPCTCSQGHLVFVTTETIETEDDYIFTTRMFAFYQDWEDHIDMTLTGGAFEIPLLDSEDDAWGIHLRAQKLTQKQR